MQELLDINVSSLFYGQKQLLQDLRLKVQSGEKILLIGPTGCGKSSLLSTLNLMNQNYQGEIRFEGSNIKLTRPELLRSRICMVMQEPYLEDASVQEILDLPLQYNAIKHRHLPNREQHIKDLMQAFQLPAEYLLQNAQKLSGGEKQRVALIRVLQLNPDILLLDEISSALDQSSSGIISDYIFNAYPGAVIAISHDPLWQKRWKRTWRVNSGRLSDSLEEQEA